MSKELLEGPTIPLTFAQIAERLGIEVASAKARARRGKWRRVPGNDGRTLVHVPVEILPEYHELPLVELPPKAKPGSELPDAANHTLQLLNELEKKHAAQIEALKQENAATQGQIRQDHSAELERLTQAHQAEIQRLMTVIEKMQDKPSWWQRFLGRRIGSEG